MYVIQKNVPLPTNIKAAAVSHKYNFHLMEIGDSFFVPFSADGEKKGFTPADLRYRVNAAARKFGTSFSAGSRRAYHVAVMIEKAPNPDYTGDHAEGSEPTPETIDVVGVRCWRLEDPKAETPAEPEGGQANLGEGQGQTT